MAFDEAPQATIVVGPDWRVVHWGLAAERLFGWTRSEAVGEVIDRLTDAGSNNASPRLRDIAVDEAGRGRAVLMRRHMDGRLMHVEVALQTVRDVAGAVRFHVASKRDVSGEQLQRDVELVDDRYRDLLDSVPDAIVIANDVGSIVLFNVEAARLFGVTAESMIGKPVECLIPERFARGHSRHRERFGSQPERRPMGSGLELRGRRGDGSEFPVEVSLSPLRLGERRFAMAALRDLSERVRLEEVQKAADKALLASSAKTEFLSRMSHELRTPLNAIMGFAQVLRVDAHRRLDETQHHQVSQILRAGRHLLAMMNDLLDLTRIEAGALALSVESVGVADVLDEVMAICEQAAGDAGVTLDFAVHPVDLCVRADRLRLRQVLLNLITNAIKYNRRGGHVAVLSERAGTEVRIAVRDTGEGLSRDQLERLYRPFDRLGAETGKVEGHGIGLVIARGLAQGMGGRLGAESTPGLGSTFTLFLAPESSPAIPATPERSTAGPSMATDGGAAGPRWCLLCVEDNEANIEVVQAVVALRPQWRLVVARSGAQAVEWVSKASPHLILLDMHLPDTHGIELARRWAADPASARIPLAALSADVTAVRALSAAEQGFTRHFTKPLEVDLFLAWLDDFERRIAQP